MGVSLPHINCGNANYGCLPTIVCIIYTSSYNFYMEVETKKCTECKSDIPKDARRCSHCSAKQSKQFGIVALLIGVLLAIVLPGWFFSSDINSNSSSSYPNSSVSQNANQPVFDTELLELMSFNCYTEYGYFHITGEVKNISTKSLENVSAVGNAYTPSGQFVKSSDALLSYNPILPGQTSPFEVLMTGNPEISKCSVDFKYLFGGSIKTKKSE
ncbi:MAG: hypothetical protein UU18_C0001G0019 [Parcubacteria group bacterium GW2011_GWB2_40_8]|nr:MAG: hypothetical protein UT71_C0014G0007 [Parcubacteria group bacterium GW2011_GWF2_40_10]KKR75622.1 MAG: hypothetical protein UU18_C0001G0019 [Parcubacteria group bacterium GW2011_GWB2_40_8]KKR77490.1 MAG: hypothetical protein UU20_C0006G0004 [Parcubacteria group bacterium GW2011_GWE2_40_8]KKR81148.1 MAG: hypothetical protein UU28_C0027G0007 [Parcubacteria group bacterium GW2011_GWD2_40_9]